MKKLTAKEEEIMELFWQHESLFVKQLQELYDDPKPHFNTLSTIVRTLEEKGYLGHTVYGSSHQYHPAISAEQHKRGSLRNVIDKYFNNSYKSAVSTLLEEENISVDELKGLIEEIEKKQKK